MAARPRIGAPAIATAAGVLLLVALAVLAFLQWQRADDLAATDERIEAASLAAGRFVTELLGYDHQALDAHEAGVVSRATERFVTEYERALDAGLRDSIVALEAVATATVRDVFIGVVDGDEVEAVVIVDTEVVSRTGTRQLVGAYLQVALDFDEESGVWLVDEVTSVATLDEILTPLEGDGGPEGSPSPSPSSEVSSPSPSPAASGG